MNLKNLSYSDIWAFLAAEMEREEREFYMPVRGLCAQIDRLEGCDLITEEQHETLHAQMYAYRHQLERQPNPYVYWWPEGERRPRIEACRKLAELTK